MFRQNLPGDGTSATESTTSYLSYDDRNLYVAIVCHDETSQVRAHLGKRAATDQDNGAGVRFDTFHDFHRAYYFDTLWDNTGRVLPDGESRNSG